MLGIILLYYVGKPFYELAEVHLKNKWLWAILGCLIYYLGTIIAGLGLFIMFDIADYESRATKFLIELFCVPFGLLAAWGFYKALENSWKKKSNSANADIDILDDFLIKRIEEEENKK